jgi:Glycosyl hydrolases family 2, sugar binding domain/Glycosyl hydrolases family 2/Glycosyl hydrolases family 2, TIM barrel domain
VTSYRDTLSLDGTWSFVADPERLYGPADLPAGDPVSVPGCWEAQVSRPYRIITAWYRRSFELPADWRGSRLVIRFGAVMYQCAVWLNGQPLGSHEGGYTSFAFDAQPAARWGETNELAVRVVNPINAIDEYPAFSVEEVLLYQEFEPDHPLAEAPHGKQTWYSSMSGLWQSVSIERTSPLAIGPLHVRPDVPNGRADVRWSLVGDVAGAGDIGLALTIVDPDGRDVATEQVAVGMEQTSGEWSLPVPQARLWDIDQPNLYQVRASLMLDGEPADETRARFGMREIATRDGKILLNGRPVYVLGALDQDLYADTISTPPSRELLDRQIRLARELGINLLRCHIKVPDPAYLEAADEAGILVWCELPNWSRFSSAAAIRGRETLAAMVDSLGNHPSIVIWTIINEDWGTQLRYEARDRHWLRETYHWLKELDPTRLVVDNSACETPSTPNFHLETDLADFHVYFAAPDNGVRWRNLITDYAKRPRWLWSPHGDARSRGDEPLLISEFGTWGLPRVRRLLTEGSREPWWFGTGRAYYLPSGVRRRFTAYGLDRIWGSLDELADATQWHQFDALQYEIGQMRRQPEIEGYVITELTDAYWEANGLLDVTRAPKAYHDRVKQINSPDAVVADIAWRDLCSRDPLRAEITLSSYGEPSPGGGRIEWELRLSDGSRTEGRMPVEAWPEATATVVGQVIVDMPDVEQPLDAYLTVRAFDDHDRQRAIDETRLAVLPASSRQSAAPLSVTVHDPLTIWGVAERVSSLGHRVGRSDEPDLMVSTEVTADMIERVEAGGRALVLVRSRAAVPEGHDLARRVGVHLRRLPHSGWPGQRSPWEGDWVTAFSWLLHDRLPGLPDRNPLDFAYEQVLPDHVLLGYDPARHRDEVISGMFVGWVHTPAALIWTFRQGRGTITLTTFRVAPETGPVATLLLERLIQLAANADRRTTPRTLRPAEAGANGAGNGASAREAAAVD